MQSFRLLPECIYLFENMTDKEFQTIVFVSSRRAYIYSSLMQPLLRLRVTRFRLLPECIYLFTFKKMIFGAICYGFRLLPESIYLFDESRAYGAPELEFSSPSGVHISILLPKAFFLCLFGSVFVSFRSAYIYSMVSLSV